MQKQRWYTIVEMIDEETGEIIDKNSVYNNNLKFIKNEIKHERNENNQNIRRITKLYRTNEQTRMQF